MTSDLGNGKFDGTWLVMNFDSLGPANWLWGKQYEIYTNIDTGAERYLDFEKWWGDFIQLTGDELQFLVDNFFIGDKLTRNQLQSRDGTTFDVRNITSPIIVFTSTSDNISPPPQTLGFILDLYRDVDDSLVPWQPVLDKRIGQHITGIVHDGGGIEWSLGRKRGLGL
jgi:poly(3-hydroxyalkanoate) synthetase